MSEKDTFNYTYSAKEQEEIKNIRNKYLAPEKEDKMTTLRKLDAAVTQKATVVSLILGIIGALILGGGMSLIMTDLGKVLDLGNNTCMLIGVCVGVVGIVLVSLAYPLYNLTVKKEREKIAPQIISLTDELLK